MTNNSFIKEAYTNLCNKDTLIYSVSGELRSSEIRKIRNVNALEIHMEAERLIK